MKEEEWQFVLDDGPTQPIRVIDFQVIDGRILRLVVTAIRGDEHIIPPMSGHLTRRANSQILTLGVRLQDREDITNRIYSLDFEVLTPQELSQFLPPN